MAQDKRCSHSAEWQALCTQCTLHVQAYVPQSHHLCPCKIHREFQGLITSPQKHLEGRSNSLAFYTWQTTTTTHYNKKSGHYDYCYFVLPVLSLFNTRANQHTAVLPCADSGHYLPYTVRG